MLTVAKDVKRRISYTGEFSGKIERPDFSEMKSNITIFTQHGEVAIDTLVRFVDEVYSLRLKQLLEEYFSKYDLGSIFDYINEYEGKTFISVEKAGNQSAEMTKHKQFGAAVRTCAKEFSEEVKKCMPRYEKADISGWINQAQKTPEALWARLRQRSKEDFPTCISVFFERVKSDNQEKKFELRIGVEAQDSKCVNDAESSAEEKYYRHARLLDIEKKAGLDYFVVGALPGEIIVSNKSRQELWQEIQSGKKKKVQIGKVMSEADVRNKSAYEVYQFMIQAVYELEPYYNAAVEGGTEIHFSRSAHSA